jgi:DNA-binding NarL/FixJ family response regulator
MRNNSIVIATNADFLAEVLRDTLRDLDVGPIVVARDENELMGRTKNSFPWLALVEDCFRGPATEEYVQKLAGRYRDLRIAVWSAQEVKPVTAARFILAGAESYFSLREAGEDIAGILGRIAAGRRYCPAEVKAVVDSDTYFPGMKGKLTMRETEVVKLSTTGRKNREIAEMLGISVATVKLHKVNIYRKCGGNTPVDILRYALTQGLIRPEDLGASKSLSGF